MRKNNVQELFNKLGVEFSLEEGKLVVGEGYSPELSFYGKVTAKAGTVKVTEHVVIEDGGRKEDYLKTISNFDDKNILKNELGSVYLPREKSWYLPCHMIIELFREFSGVTVTGTAFDLVSAVFDKLNFSEKVMELKKPEQLIEGDIDISDFVLPEGIRNIELYPHQKKGVKFLLSNKRVVLGLAVGLGKTPSAIVAVQELKNRKEIDRAIVVAPSSVKFNWKLEIEKFSSMKAEVVSSKDMRAKNVEATIERMKAADIIIANYEMLRKQEVADVLHDLAPDCIIADESHKLKNPKASQTSGFKKYWSESEYVFFLTATPFPNGKPRETHTMLHHLRPDIVSDWKNFGKKYVNFEKTKFGNNAKGLKEVAGLQKEIAPIVFMRNHYSSDVETALPKERHTTFNLEMNDEQKKLYKVVADDVLAEIAKLEKRGVNAASPIILTKLMKLEQVAIDPDMLVEDENSVDLSKLYPKEEWTVDTIVQHFDDDSYGGVVVFCNKKLPLLKVKHGLLKEGFSEDDIGIIAGSTKVEERTAIQEKFRAGNLKVVLCTSAGEEGINLQDSCNTLIHLDQVWTPSSITQREGRILRTGNKSSHVKFLSPVIFGTVEDKKRSTIAEKVEVIETLLGKGSTGSAFGNISDFKGGGFSMDDIRGMI